MKNKNLDKAYNEYILVLSKLTKGTKYINEIRNIINKAESQHVKGMKKMFTVISSQFIQ